MLNTLETYSGKVTWEVVTKLASLLDTDHYLDATSYDFFKHLDLYIFIYNLLSIYLFL